ncbi:MAG: hypothetical protein DI530_16370 [Sphingomonas sp.]|uniref:Barstar (barnase inhibitor) domain-containing protein n=1 Tax=Sphingomonas adhaesiva TaxID=28212 RepID=A0A2A4I9M1_9SPHN|nr:hypothetical protein COA07_06660 [Sphingomonas adhaesiva]PZU74382.1 MAG: hypothetical protein DI530_16370 [Sphingomonas sp.]
MRPVRDGAVPRLQRRAPRSLPPRPGAPRRDGVACVPVTVIRLDARGWHDRDDLWRDLLAGLGAPDWHGANLDALYDGLVAGENRARPPLVVEIAGAARLSAALVAQMTRVREVFDDAARDGAAVAMRFVAPISAAAR